MTKKLLVAHSDECYYANGQALKWGRKFNDEWVLPEHQWLNRDILGRKSSTCRGFLVFKCNCGMCEARLAIPFEQAHKAIFG